jgi:3-phenylpropionate/trans-cinnamate dioxygenase ferredoxin subunit
MRNQENNITTKELKPGKMAGIEIKGKPVLVANIEGKYYAMGNKCTHQECDISDGELTGDIVECPCHGSRFNVKTGAVVGGPARKAEPSYNVRVEGEQIIIDVQ